ncbi:MAG: WD40 repeat domain-containing protein [Pseudomonadales bacterium]
MPVFKILIGGALCLLLSACSPGEPPVSWQKYATLGLYTASLSPDGRFAVIGAQEEGGSLWNVSREERLYDWNHKKDARTIIATSAFSPEGDFAVTANQQDLVLWHTSTGKPVWFWSSPGEILDIALTPKGNYALLGLANHTAVFFDIVNGGIQRTLRHEGRVRTVALSADGKTAITGADDYTATVWDIKSAKALQQLTFENIVDTVALSRDGSLAFTASSLDRGVVWDTASGEIVSYISGDESFMQKRISYLSARFSEDGSELLTGTSSGLTQLWDTRTGNMLKKWRGQKKESYGPTSLSILAVAFNKDGGYLSIGSNGILNEYD